MYVAMNKLMKQQNYFNCDNFEHRKKTGIIRRK